jgi:hypothetical protein
MKGSGHQGAEIGIEGRWDRRVDTDNVNGRSDLGRTDTTATAQQHQSYNGDVMMEMLDRVIGSTVCLRRNDDAAMQNR